MDNFSELLAKIIYIPLQSASFLIYTDHWKRIASTRSFVLRKSFYSCKSPQVFAWWYIGFLNTWCWNEGWFQHSALFLHHCSSNFLRITSLPPGSYWTTQNRFQPDFWWLNGRFPIFTPIRDVTYHFSLAIGFFSMRYLTGDIVNRSDRGWETHLY